MLVWIGYWEGGRMVLVSTATQEVHELSGCRPDASWLPNGQAFAMAVEYSGYLGCGEQDGIYIVSAAGGIVSEERIYFDPASTDPADGAGSSSVSWSPTGDWITFVQTYYTPDFDDSESRLMLVRPDGTEARTLASTQDGRIITPVWTGDGGTIYYAIWSRDGSHIYRAHIHSAEATLLHKSPDRERLISLSPDGQWLVFGQDTSSYEHMDLKVLNLRDDGVIPIAHVGPTPFIGWERID
jgi:Tol biopolymer transport system component